MFKRDYLLNDSIQTKELSSALPSETSFHTCCMRQMLHKEMTLSREPTWPLPSGGFPSLGMCHEGGVLSLEESHPAGCTELRTAALSIGKLSISLLLLPWHWQVVRDFPQHPLASAPWFHRIICAPLSAAHKSQGEGSGSQPGPPGSVTWVCVQHSSLELQETEAKADPTAKSPLPEVHIQQWLFVLP